MRNVFEPMCVCNNLQLHTDCGWSHSYASDQKQVLEAVVGEEKRLKQEKGASNDGTGRGLCGDPSLYFTIS